MFRTLFRHLRLRLVLLGALCTACRAEKHDEVLLGTWRVLNIQMDQTVGPGADRSLTPSGIQPQYICFGTNGRLYVSDSTATVDSADFKVVRADNLPADPVFGIDLYQPENGELLYRGTAKIVYPAGIQAGRPETLEMSLGPRGLNRIPSRDSAAKFSIDRWVFQSSLPLTANTQPGGHPNTQSPNCFD